VRVVADGIESALVLDEPALEGRESLSRAVRLGQGKALVPLTEGIWDCIGGDLADNPDDAGNLDYFMSVVLRCAGFEGLRGRVAYVEAQIGRESAIATVEGLVLASSVWEEGQADASSVAAEKPIDAALRAVGVDRGDWPDERSAIGLFLPFAP